MDSREFSQQIYSEGYAILPGVIPASLLPSLKAALVDAIDGEDRYREMTGAKIDYAMVLLCSLYGRELVDVLALESLMDPFEWILGTGCIIYAYTSSSMPPRGANFSTRIHVDCPRLVPGYITNMGATILLDEFTEENGATWFLPNSHERRDAPSEEEFFSNAKRVIAPAGSVFYFNARLWHSGGANRTEVWRHALTINMCRPFMKQRIDIPRAMAHMDLGPYPARALQKLGFLAQAPANYDEYYAPPERRAFRQRYE